MEGYDVVQLDIQRKYDACRKQLLELSKNQDFVLDASDKKWNQEIEECCDLNFSKENIQEELMIVHATDYFPENGEIKTSKNANVIYGDEEVGKYFSHRNTIHFSLNHRVTQNDGGNWSDMKYMILMPFQDLNIQNLVSLEAVDSYVEGNIALSDNTVILVNEENYEELSEEQKKQYCFFKFKGDSKIALQEALILLGKKPQRVHVHNLLSEENAKAILEYRERLSKEYGKSFGLYHFGSAYKAMEDKTRDRDRILYKLRNGNIPDTREQEQVISFAEVEEIIGEIEDTTYGRAEFLRKYIFSGIEKREDGQYYLLEDNKALVRAKNMRK